jgi:serine/threonine protein kinase
MDSLATGACDRGTFLRGIGELVKRTPDAGWDLLALIDQYYRLGKIDSAAFGSLKSHLQSLVMGQIGTGEISVPLRHTRPEPKAASATIAGDMAGSMPGSTPGGMPGDASSIALAPPFSAAEEPHAERMLVPGDVLRGRYRVVAMLGQGGMGTVFEAVDQFRLDGAHGDQKVAIKVLHTAVIQRPRLFAELRREFQHLQSLSHPHIVRVHEFDRDGDLAFFTMEYLSGVLLRRVIASHGVTGLHRPYAFAIVRDVGAAVAHAHARGVIHGDLNPGNIFITDSGEVRVLDFGAAHQLRRTPWISDFEGTQQITVATPRFASCQLLEGETADARDDVYALACIAYVLLSGRHPYRDHSALKARTLRLKPVRPAAISGRQWRALRAGLEFERDRRPTDIPSWLQELASPTAVRRLPELPALLSVQPSQPERKRWMVAAAALVLATGGAWWVGSHGRELQQSTRVGVATFKKNYANTMLGQLWNDGRGDDANRETELPAASDATAAEVTAPAAPTAAAASSALAASGAPGASTAPASTAPASTAPTASRTLRDGAPPASPPVSPRNGSRLLVASSATPGAPVLASAAAPAVVPTANPIHARIELAADNIDVPPGDTLAHVVVRRTRSLRGDVSFNWWTESGTAKPGKDFTPVKTHVEHIEDGKNVADLTIPVVADAARHEAKSFYIVIDEASDNAALGPRTLTMVTLPGAD